MKLYNLLGLDFIALLRGSFYGLIFDRFKDNVIIFNDHIGSKSYFYTRYKQEFVASSNLTLVKEFVNLNYSINNKVNEFAVKNLLVYGCMLENETLFLNIFKLRYGSIYDTNNHSITNFYTLINKENPVDNINEVINDLDYLFRQAIKRAFNKDLEYNLKHFVHLSGGFDSRMVNVVANDMGYGNNIHSITFAQSDSLDYKYAKKMSKNLRHYWHYFAFDNANFMVKLDEIIKINYGLSNVTGIAHVNAATKALYNNRFGIVHSGQLGDAILGTVYSDIKHIEPNIHDGSIGSFWDLTHSNKISEILKTYKNKQIFLFENRGLNAINDSFKIYDSLETYSYSPFLDVDFLNYVLKILLRLKYKNKLYFQWMENYPISKSVKSTRSELQSKSLHFITSRLYFNIKGNKLSLNEIAFILKSKTLNKLGLISKSNMNPFEYWEKQNPKIEEKIYVEVMKEIVYLNVSENLKIELIRLMEKKKKVMDKYLVYGIVKALAK